MKFKEWFSRYDIRFCGPVQVSAEMVAEIVWNKSKEIERVANCKSVCLACAGKWKAHDSIPGKDETGNWVHPPKEAGGSHISCWANTILRDAERRDKDEAAE